MPLVTPSSVPTAALPLPDPADLSTWPARMKELHRWMRNDAAPAISALGDAAYQNALHAQTMANTASGTANFKGNWSALTGALNTPASVYHNSKLWLLLTNLANVTTATPGVSASWLDITNVLMGVQTAADARAVLGVPAITDVPTTIAPLIAPTLSAPADASSSSGASFTVAAFAPTENIGTYGLQIQRATNSGFTTGVEYSTVTQDSSATRTMVASPVGQVRYWRSRWVCGGVVSPWSSSRSYTGVDPFAYIGRVHQASAALSVTGTAVGDLMILAWAGSITTPPSGWTFRGTFTSGVYAPMQLFTKIATSANESVANSSEAYGAALYVYRGITDYVGTPSPTAWAAGVGTMTVVLPSGSDGKPVLLIGFDRDASTWTGPTAWLAGGGPWQLTSSTYYKTVSGYTASAASGQTATRSASSYNAIVLALRLQ